MIAVALKYNVAPCFLEYIGKQDESETVGKVFYHFNIVDEKHEKYKSTVAAMVTV